MSVRTHTRHIFQTHTFPSRTHSYTRNTHPHGTCHNHTRTQSHISHTCHTHHTHVTHTRHTHTSHTRTATHTHVHASHLSPQSFSPRLSLRYGRRCVPRGDARGRGRGRPPGRGRGGRRGRAAPDGRAHPAPLLPAPLQRRAAASHVQVSGYTFSEYTLRSCTGQWVHPEAMYRSLSTPRVQVSEYTQRSYTDQLVHPQIMYRSVGTSLGQQVCPQQVQHQLNEYNPYDCTFRSVSAASVSAPSVSAPSAQSIRTQ